MSTSSICNLNWPALQRGGVWLRGLCWFSWCALVVTQASALAAQVTSAPTTLASLPSAEQVEQQANAAYQACATAYDENPTHGADRAFADCTLAKIDVYETASRAQVDMLQQRIPAACLPALASVVAGLQQQTQRQQQLAAQLTQARPGSGETAAAGLYAIAVIAQYRYLAALTYQLEQQLDVELCPSR